MKTCEIPNPPCVLGRSCIGGAKEGAGPHGSYLDIALQDDTMAQDSFEKAECALFTNTVLLAIQKSGFLPSDMDCLAGGDLLNQIISANYGARELEIPFLGVYGACSTMVETLIIGSTLISGGFAQKVVCAACSHFSTAERQYRLPLEMGTQATPTAQRTVTGAGATVLGAQGSGPRLTRFTIGRVVDLGITDATNMGAAMAPAAADTIIRHFRESCLPLDYYDAIYTGDLGTFGHELLKEFLAKEGMDFGDMLHDCGCEIFLPEDAAHCGGSGCGCAAITLNGYLLNALEQRTIRRLLLVATGALMSPTASYQGESIPGIAHAIAIESVNRG